MGNTVGTCGEKSVAEMFCSNESNQCEEGEFRAPDYSAADKVGEGFSNKQIENDWAKQMTSMNKDNGFGASAFGDMSPSKFQF